MADVMVETDGLSVEQAATQLLQLLTAETSASSVRPIAATHTHDDRPQKNRGSAEYRLENLDEYSDAEVNSLLTELLADEEVSE